MSFEVLSRRGTHNVTPRLARPLSVRAHTVLHVRWRVAGVRVPLVCPL